MWYGFKRKRHRPAGKAPVRCDSCGRQYPYGARQVKSCPEGDAHWICLHCYDSPQRLAALHRNAAQATGA